jgi:hypothetical protein
VEARQLRQAASGFSWANPTTANCAAATFAAPGIAADAPTRFFRRCAQNASAATKARPARTYPRGASIRHFRHPLDAVAHTRACPDVFTFKPLDLVICVQRACRLARRAMPPAWLRELIKE